MPGLAQKTYKGGNKVRFGVSLLPPRLWQGPVLPAQVASQPAFLHYFSRSKPSHPLYVSWPHHFAIGFQPADLIYATVSTGEYGGQLASYVWTLPRKFNTEPKQIMWALYYLVGNVFWNSSETSISLYKGSCLKISLVCILPRIVLKFICIPRTHTNCQWCKPPRSKLDNRLKCWREQHILWVRRNQHRAERESISISNVWLVWHHSLEKQ